MRSGDAGTNKNRIHLNRGIDRQMNLREGRFGIQRQLLVKVLIIFLLDLARLLAPEGRLLVNLFVFLAQVNREGNIIRMFFDNLAQAVFLGEFGSIFL